MTKLRRPGLWVSAAAASALLIAPVALAEEDHGDHQNRGRRGDEQAVLVQEEPKTSVNVDVDNRDDDVIENMNEDANEPLNEDRDELQVAPGQAQPSTANDQEVNDRNDDKD